MTVGDLVYKQAIESGYNPTFAEGLISPLNDVVEAYQKVFEHMREPLKTVNSVIESVRPQIEAMAKMSIPAISQITMPTLPETLGEEEGYLMPSLIRPIQEVRIVNPEDIAVAPARQDHKYVTASYQLPGNAKWESLEIQFVDGHVVNVSYPNMKSQRFDFKDMGFMNLRTARPDMKWELLRILASHGGSLTKEHWDRRFHRNIKYELAEGLRKFFGMTTSPIPRYKTRDGYATLFVIREL
jgi:hypothetical protein